MRVHAFDSVGVPIFIKIERGRLRNRYFLFDLMWNYPYARLVDRQCGKRDATFNSHGHIAEGANAKRWSECQLEILSVMCEWMRVHMYMQLIYLCFFSGVCIYLWIQIPSNTYPRHQSDKVM